MTGWLVLFSCFSPCVHTPFLTYPHCVRRKFFSVQNVEQYHGDLRPSTHVTPPPAEHTGWPRHEEKGMGPLGFPITSQCLAGAQNIVVLLKQEPSNRGVGQICQFSSHHCEKAFWWEPELMAGKRLLSNQTQSSLSRALDFGRYSQQIT